MNVEAFLDTNVLVYRFSGVPEEAAKRRRADEVMAAQPYGISSQVLAELYVTLIRKGYLEFTPAEARDVVENFSGTPCAPIDPELVVRGIEISQQFQISYWDGAIIAAAQRLGAAVLYSEDLNDGQRYGSVVVKNPFAGL